MIGKGTYCCQLFLEPTQGCHKLSHIKIRLGNTQTDSAILFQHWKWRQSLLSDTAIFIAGHINLLDTQAMQVDENKCLVT